MSMLEQAMCYFNSGFNVIAITSPIVHLKKLGIPVSSDINRQLAQIKADNSELSEEIIRAGKTPLYSWKQYQNDVVSVKDINNWFQGRHLVNIGIITGEISNLMVIDVDAESADQLIHSRIDLPNSPIVTSGKGKHYYFKRPQKGFSARSSKEYKIDIRCDGSYIMAPPSLHGAGVNYEWVEGKSIFDIEPPEVSEELLDFLCEIFPDEAVKHGRLAKSSKSVINMKMFAPITKSYINSTVDNNIDTDKIISLLPLKTRKLIVNGNSVGGQYPSRSEADMAVVQVLVRYGVEDEAIFAIFNKYAIGEKFREHGDRVSYLSHTISKAKTNQSLLTEAEMENPLFHSGSIVKADNGKCKLEVAEFQKHISDKFKIIVNEYGQIYHYTGKNYRVSTEIMLNHLCQKELGEYRRLLGKNDFSELQHFLRGDTMVESDIFDLHKKQYMTFQNGILDVDGGNFIDHTHDIFTTSILPYDFDEMALCPMFDKFLDEAFEGDSEIIYFLQEIVGYCLYPAIPTNGMFMFVGEGSNGKSTLLNTISKMLGNENVSNIQLNNLNNPNFVMQIQHKYANIITEGQIERIRETDSIKQIISGEYIIGRELYKDPIKFRPHAKMLISMNKFPEISDHTHGMWRKLFIIDFPKIFQASEIDTELEQKLEQELPGILAWALCGLNRLKSRKFKFSEPQSVKHNREKHRHESDPVLSIIHSIIEKTNNPNDIIKFSNLYEVYETARENDRFAEISKTKLGRKLNEAGYCCKKSALHGNQNYIFSCRIKSEQVSDDLIH